MSKYMVIDRPTGKTTGPFKTRYLAQREAHMINNFHGANRAHAYEAADDVAPAVDEIKVGDRVRSYDFEHRRDCYVEGVVLAIGEEIEGCPRYRVMIDEQVFAGKRPSYSRIGEEAFPPVNGTPALFSETGFTNFVEKI